MGISAPLLSKVTDRFKFDLKLTENELYQANRLEGAVSVRDVLAVDVRAGLQTEVLSLPPSPAGQADAQPSTAPSSTSTDSNGNGDQPNPIELNTGSGDGRTPSANDGSAMQETGVPASGFTSAVLPDRGAASAAVGGFTPALSTFASADLAAINPRRHLRLTASDWWELNLHKFFSMPDPKQFIGDYVPMFLTFNVSCIPGWRTREGFSGMVDVRVEYVYEDRPLFADPDSKSVIPVVGLYPAYDSEELNLRSSERDLATFAAQLAATGQTQAAKVFLETARKREQDAETNTGLATMTSYSLGGQGFGYEFRPTFRALGNPGSTRAHPGYRLEPITVPAVALALVDWDQLKASLKVRLRDTVADVLSCKVKKIAKRRSQYATDQRDAGWMGQRDVDRTERSLGRAGEPRIRLEAAIEDFLIDRSVDDTDTLRKEACKQLGGDEDTCKTEKKKAVEDKARELLRAELQNKNSLYTTVRDALLKVLSVDPAECVRNTSNLRLLDDFLDFYADQEVNHCTLVLYITHSWRPLSAPWLKDIPGLKAVGRAFQPRLSEQRLTERLIKLGTSYQNIEAFFSDYDRGILPEAEGNRYAYEYLRTRWLMLGAQAINFTPIYRIRAVDFKPPEPPKLANKPINVCPPYLWDDADTTLAIFCKDLKKADVKKVLVGGIDCSFIVTGKESLVAVVPKYAFHNLRSQPSKSVSTFVTLVGADVAQTPVNFEILDAPTSVHEPSVSVERDANGRISKIVISGDATATGKDGPILDAIRAIIEKQECCEDVKVELLCPTGCKPLRIP